MPTKIDIFPKKQSHKQNALVAYVIGYIKIILALLVKIIALYIQVLIV